MHPMEIKSTTTDRTDGKIHNVIHVIFYANKTKFDFEPAIVGIHEVMTDDSTHSATGAQL